MRQRYQEFVLKCLRNDFGTFEGTAREKEVEFLKKVNTEVSCSCEDTSMSINSSV